MVQGVNLDISTLAQSEAKARARTRTRTRMLAKSHIPAQLQEPSIDYLAKECGGRGVRGGEGTTRQSKSKEGVGGSRTFPTWRRGFEV
jgi:hypothetical protein